MRLSLLSKKTWMLAAAGLGILAGSEATAQLTLTGTSYTQDFNNIGTALPLGWSVDTGATSSFLGYNINSAFIATPAANTAWSSTAGGFKNYASATAFPNYAAGTVALQTSETNRALGVRQVSATDSRVAFVLEIANTSGLSNFNLSFKLQSLDSATAPRIATWTVDYATGSNPTTFTPVATTGTMTTGGATYSNNTITASFGTALDNQAGPVYIRIAVLNPTTGSGNRPSTAIDDYTLTWNGSGTATNILLTSKTPTGPNVPLATPALTLKFDNPIAAGTGSISLYKSGNPTAVYSQASSGAAIGPDSTATFSGIVLENNTHYYVLLDGGAFTKTGGTLPSLAITDTTSWTFTTVDTVTPPPPTPMTTLDETFTGCTNNAMGVFVQYSAAGNKTWRCSTFGHGDSASVYINAGSSSGSEASEDWLISKAPFDFSAMTAPELSFWQKRRFGGNVIRTLKYSTDYTGGNPADATWNDINVPALGSDPSTEWSKVSDISLTSIKGTPFYLAFTYTCGTDSAYELTYDDVLVEEDGPIGIFGPSRGQLQLKVLGDATAAAINLGISLEKPEHLTVQLYDITGRRVYSEAIKALSGQGVYTLSNTGLKAGMYVIRVSNGKDSGVIKVMVK